MNNLIQCKCGAWLPPDAERFGIYHKCDAPADVAHEVAQDNAPPPPAVVAGRRVATVEEIKSVGDFAIVRDGDAVKLFALFPNDDSVACIPCFAGIGTHWTLSGTDDKPTLDPSVNIVGIWHGWLKNGEFISC